LHHFLEQHVRRFACSELAADLEDEQLLDQFVACQDEAAFTTLVRRHGPIVMGVCRRVLGDCHDAEDAFQATFLVLVRKAHAIGSPHLLGNWLYGVAFRIAQKARTSRMRRLLREQQVAAPIAQLPDEGAGADLGPVFEEELNRLPDKYRAPLVLCYLEGKAYSEAARLLGCPPGTISGRLARARELLRSRLGRRGIGLSATLLGSVLAERSLAAPVPAELAGATVRLARLLALGSGVVPTASAQIVALSEGVLQAMFVTRIKATVLGLALVLLAAGLGLLAHAAVAARPEPADRSSPAAQPARSEGRGVALETLWADLASNDDGKVARATLALAASPRATVPFLKGHLFRVTSDPARLARLLGELDSPEFDRRQKAMEELEYLGTRAVPTLRKALAAGPELEARRRMELVLRKIETESATDLQKVKIELAATGTSLQRLEAEAKSRSLLAQLEKLKADRAVALATRAKLKTEEEKRVAQLRAVEAELETVLMKMKIEELTLVQQEKGKPITVPEAPSVWWVRAVRAIAILESIGSPEARQLLEHLGSGDADALPTREAKGALDRLGKRTAP
jgi:RNA polymerase sigma factor (sigma-70 family)